jgi:ubiquinone/menaquinone biosynthesis C-methylase UbiE
VRPTSKPTHLGPQYADQFKDLSVASAYLHRPPYPAEVFDLLECLIKGRPRVVLDMGCGTGDIAIPMADRVDRVDAVDPSEAMLRMARTRPGWDRENIRWVCTSAEEFDYRERYGLITAGASLHWMDWYVVLGEMRRSLLESAFLAIASGRQEENSPWRDRSMEIIPRYSTNRDFQPYDLIEELESRSLFRVVGRQRSAPARLRMPIRDYVEMIHSQNGFSRERMTAESAAAFDSESTAAITPFASGNEVSLELTSTVTLGRPLEG